MKLDIHSIIEQMRSDPTGISSKFGIPLRTVYGWCNGSRKPPEYVLMMMLNILYLEGRIKAYGEKERMAEEMGISPEGGPDTCKKS